jgi:hypothetical protein
MEKPKIYLDAPQYRADTLRLFEVINDDDENG